jgi:hypothetical protein
MNGCLFIQEELSWAVPNPQFVAELWLVENKLAYRISTSRLEHMIERKLVNALGTKLTKRGKCWISI